MEDQPINNELGVDNEAEVRRPATDSFLAFLRQLNSAEAVADQPESVMEDDDEDDEETVANRQRENQEKTPRKRLGRWFRAVFGKVVRPPSPSSLERLPLAAAGATAGAAAEVVIEHAEQPAATEAAQAEVMPTPSEEVIIQHDDHLDELPLPNGVSTEQNPADRLQQGGPQPEKDKDQYNSPERIGRIVRRVEHESLAGLAAAELAAHRREKKAKRRTTELKKQAKSMEKEQKELKERQKAFEKQLDKKLKKANNQETAKKPEKHPIKEETISQKGVRQEAQPPTAPENELQKLVQAEGDRPEVVLERVEVAAAHDLPIERLYEQRHEIKDNSKQDLKMIHTGGLTAGSVRKIQRSAGAELRAVNAKLQHIEQLATTPSPSPATQPQPKSVYTQAIAGGFMAALVILAMLAVVLLF